MIMFDDAKAKRLLAERNVDMEEIGELLAAGKYIEVIKNEARTGQRMFVFKYKGYIHVAPFVRDAEGNFIIKTVYPSRKFSKTHGGKK